MRWPGSSAAPKRPESGTESGPAAAGPPRARPSAKSRASSPRRAGSIRYRPVTIVDAGQKKALALSIQVPVEDMARLTTADEIPSGPLSVGDTRPSIWAAIHPRLLDLIRAHRSTLIFVNSRRLAERLAGALNELAGETLVRSHHGSIAREQRVEVEDLLKAGSLRALVATSSLELGIDMGAIDLVVQIESPPSVASGLQRIGRGGSSGERRQQGRDLPEVSRRSGRLRRRGEGDARRRRRGDALPAQSARYRRPADRRDDRDGHLGRGRAVRDHPARRAVCRAQPRRLRGRARHAVGAIPIRRVRRTAAADHLGSARGDDHRTRGLQARGRHQRRHDSRSRALMASS